MSTLYELTGEYMALLQMLEDTEDAQVVIDTLEGIDGEIEFKADNYAKVMKCIEGDIAAVKAEIDRLQARKKTMENNIDSLKKHLQYAMVTTGKTKFKTELFSFSVQKNGGKRPVIWDVDVEDLPDEFLKIEKKPNATAMAEYLDKNGENEYAHYGEQDESLRIR